MNESFVHNEGGSANKSRPCIEAERGFFYFRLFSQILGLGLRLLVPSKRELCLLHTLCIATSAVAPDSRYAFRGCPVSLIELSFCGVSLWPLFPQESPCISFANMILGNNTYSWLSLLC